MCNEVSNDYNGNPERSFRRQTADKVVKIEIFEEKVELKYPHPVSGTNFLVFERDGNIGNKSDVFGFNYKGAVRSIHLREDDLTYVTIATPVVWVSTYKCRPDF